MRKLASVQRVRSVDPIGGADKIERLKVLGWQLVSGKGNFRPDDLCVFLEIDSVPPDTATFDFLWQPSPKVDEHGTAIPQPRVPRPDNFKLRSKRLRGVLSQGLALPVSILPAGITPTEGLDVTEALGVTKWKPPIHASAREVGGAFPTHLFPKTDETRVQAVPEILDELRGAECYIAVKMDGQSLTFARYNDGGVDTHKVCMRNYAVKDLPDSPHWQMARQLRIFERIPQGFAVQGEFCGPGIQANRIGLKQKEFYAFQVYSIERQDFLDFRDFLHFCDMAGIPTVPIEWVGPLDETLESILKRAEGKYANGHPREGIVIRPTTECRSPVLTAFNGGGAARTSFKAINNAFLLKIGE
jgi:RNA ligase (TIGR02306 family)